MGHQLVLLERRRSQTRMNIKELETKLSQCGMLINLCAPYMLAVILYSLTVLDGKMSRMDRNLLGFLVSSLLIVGQVFGLRIFSSAILFSVDYFNSLLCEKNEY